MVIRDLGFAEARIESVGSGSLLAEEGTGIVYLKMKFEFVTTVDSPLTDTYMRLAHIHGKLELVPAFLLYSLFLTLCKTVITDIDGH